MATIFEKLNLKTQDEIVVVNAPSSFEPEIDALLNVADGNIARKVVRNVASAKAIDFALAFVTQQAEVDKLASAICKRAEGDAIIWFAYPKGTSKKYKCDFNRDTGWAAMGAAGFESVRMVAIDEDWSALRFRRTEFVKTLKRDEVRAISPAGKLRSAKK
jgi:hypothetical protein